MDSVYKFVMELIPVTEDIQALAEKIYKKYGLPVILSDISYHLIAYGGPVPCPDYYWNVIIETGVAAPETIINGYFKDGYMDRISVEKNPFVVDWGVSAENPQTTCAVYVGGMMEAISSVLHIEKEKEELALTINSAFRSAAEIYLNARFDKPLGAPTPDRSIAARMLLEDTGTSMKLLTGTAYFKKTGINPGFVIVAMQTRDSVSGRLQNLRSGIKSRWASMLYVNKEDGVYMFFQGVDFPAKVRQLLGDIENEAEGKTDYVCGVSDIFTDLSHRAAYVEQAQLALKYGMESPCGGHVFRFSEQYSDILLERGYSNIQPESLILPEIRTLLEADRENATNFFESFKCYLYNKCDMSKTAAQMYLHRNSLMYRIKRCQEIMEVDLNDRRTFERMYSCCRVLDMKDSANIK